MENEFLTDRTADSYHTVYVNEINDADIYLKISGNFSPASIENSYYLEKQSSSQKFFELVSDRDFSLLGCGIGQFNTYYAEGSIQAIAANRLADGETFTISDANSTVVFEFNFGARSIELYNIWLEIYKPNSVYFFEHFSLLPVP